MERETVEYTITMHRPDMWCVYSLVTKRGIFGVSSYRNYVGEFPSEDAARMVVEALKS